MTWKMPNEICLTKVLIKKKKTNNQPNKILMIYSSYRQIYFTIWYNSGWGGAGKE